MRVCIVLLEELSKILVVFGTLSWLLQDVKKPPQRQTMHYKVVSYSDMISVKHGITFETVLVVCIMEYSFMAQKQTHP